MIKKRRLSAFGRMIYGIVVEIFATLSMMAVIFVVGFFILRWFSK